MLKKALILTVGTGTRPDVDIVQPLIKTIRDSRPDYTVFVATEDSRSHAETIAQNLGLQESAWNLEILRHFDDVQDVFLQFTRVIREVLSHGFSPRDIQVDFTSGTKAMSAGAVLAAVHLNCESLKYITGEREAGIVKNGTERFVSLCPHAIFANQEIDLAIELIRRLRFQPAIQVLRAINRNLLTEDRKNLCLSLEAVAEAYDFWDRFEHIKFLGTIRKVDWNFPELSPFDIKEWTAKSVHRIGQILKQEKPEFGEELIIDLLNNAGRRAMGGRFDDALARLYRLAEMLAQFVLRNRHKIETGNVDLCKVPENIRQDLEAHRDFSDENKIKIGLRASYELLAELKEEIGIRYLRSDRLKHLLNERNKTILAHGNMPVREGLYQSLREQVIALLRIEIDDLESKAKALDFPWLV